MNREPRTEYHDVYGDGYAAGRTEALRRVEAAVLAIADEIDAEAREWDSGTLESFAVRLRAALVIRDTPPEET